MLQLIKQFFDVKLGARSSKWFELRNDFFNRNSHCKVCNSKKKLEIHHIFPVNEFPELELEWGNLIALCRRCHLLVGHLNKWDRYNSEVVKDAEYFNNKINKYE